MSILSPSPSPRSCRGRSAAEASSFCRFRISLLGILILAAPTPTPLDKTLDVAVDRLWAFDLREVTRVAHQLKARARQLGAHPLQRRGRHEQIELPADDQCRRPYLRQERPAAPGEQRACQNALDYSLWASEPRRHERLESLQCEQR